MADNSTVDGPSLAVPPFESPVHRDYPQSADAPLILADESALAKLVIKAGPDTAAAEQLAVRFGTSRMINDQPGPGVLVLGQRPEEWLIVGDRASVDAMLTGLDRAGHVSLIDHSHSRAMFRLTGPAAAQTLAKVCGLDWSDAMTPDGAVVSASVAKVTCDIARNDVAEIAPHPDGAGRSYLLACDRSFGQYLFDAILDAGQEFDIGVGPSISL